MRSIVSTYIMICLLLSIKIHDVRGFAPIRPRKYITNRNSASTSVSTQTHNNAATIEEWKVFDPKDLGTGGTYGLGISAVAPRPIAVITSKDENDVLNCAPYS